MTKASPTQTRRKEPSEEPKTTHAKQLADLVAEGAASNGVVALQFAGTEHVLQSFSHMVDALRNQGEAVNRGDLSAGERMLNSQVVALNQIFGELAQRAATNIGSHLGAAEVYLKLALKAQSQCRATLETLAAMKNPPVVFARQANINNGGQQQVNNGVGSPAG